MPTRQSTHYGAIALLATHALFLMLVPTIVEASKDLPPGQRGYAELGVTAMLGAGIIMFFLYSKWISPAKGNALIQVVNVALGTALFTAVFPAQSLAFEQWLGVALCCVGIVMMISRGRSQFLLRTADDTSKDAAGSRTKPLTRLILGVMIGFGLWLLWVDFGSFDGGWDGIQAVLGDRDNAMALFVFEVAATTLVPLAAKVAIDQAPLRRVAVTVVSIAILGVSLYFYFFYSDHLKVHKSNAVLQTVNTLAGTLLVASFYSDEALSARQWAGAVIAAVGIALTLNLLDGDPDLFRDVSVG